MLKKGSKMALLRSLLFVWLLIGLTSADPAVSLKFFLNLNFYFKTFRNFYPYSATSDKVTSEFY